MPRVKKINAILKSTRDEIDWVAEAQDDSGLSAQHYIPATALSLLGDLLREHHKADIELSYEFELPPSLRARLDQLLKHERELQELTHKIPTERVELARLLGQRQLKQQDQAKLMQLSQSYLASIIKRGASDKYAKLNPRRRST